MKSNTIQSPQRSPWRDPVVLLCMGGALAVRIAYAVSIKGLEASDPIEYDAIAWNVAQGIGFTNQGFAGPGVESWVRRPPLFVLLLAAVYTIFGHSLLAARIAQSVVGTLLCIVTVHLAVRTTGPSAARPVAAVTAVYPYLVYYSGYLMSESLATLLFFASLATLAASAGSRGRVLAGALLGGAALTRSFFLGFLAIVPLWLYGVGGSWRATLRGFTFVVLGVAAIVTPWTIRNYVVTGRFVPIQATASWGFYEYHLWFSQDDFPTFAFSQEAASWRRFEKQNQELIQRQKSLTTVDQDDAVRREALDYVLSDPVRYLRSCFRKLVWLWRPSTQARTGTRLVADGAFWLSVVTYLAWLPAFAFGLWLLWREGSTGRLLVWAVAYVTAFHTFFWYGSPRFRFPIYPVFVIACWAACGWILSGRRPAARVE